MRTRRCPAPRRTKMLAALVMGFILCNIIFVTPVFASASGQPMHEDPSWCIPIPFIVHCPTPTPTSTGTPAATPTVGPTGTASPTPTGTGTPTPTVPHLSDATSFTLQAIQIVGTNVSLNQSDFLHPVLIMQTSTIQGLKITRGRFVISASRIVTSTNSQIKTSLFHQIVTALQSFANKADLLILAAGGTVPRLVLNNVTLQVDRFIDLGTITLPGLHVTGQG